MRLFVALELPADVVAAVAGWAALIRCDGLRVVPSASLHVTLAFLGERPDEDAGPIGAAVAACAAPVPALSVGEPAWLGRGSALALDLVDGAGACAALQGAVAAALAALGVFTPEPRAFRPHVTVARVRRGARVPRTVTSAPPVCAPFAATALTLCSSQLGPGGSRYRRLSSARLR